MYIYIYTYISINPTQHYVPSMTPSKGPYACPPNIHQSTLASILHPSNAMHVKKQKARRMGVSKEGPNGERKCSPDDWSAVKEHDLIWVYHK